jgi:hypothetical protein
MKQIVESNPLQERAANLVAEGEHSSAPSCIGSTCTRNGREPLGHATTLVICRATSDGSALMPTHVKPRLPFRRNEG